MVNPAISCVLITLVDSSSLVCNTWYDTSRTKLPPPFPTPLADEGFAQMRAERKWFKNVKLIPSGMPIISASRDDHGALVFTKVMQHPFQPSTDFSATVPTTEASTVERISNTTEQPTMPDIELMPQTAEEIVTMVADILSIPVKELKEMSASGADMLSLGLDSLLCVEIIFKLEKMGIHLEMPQVSHFLMNIMHPRSPLTVGTPYIVRANKYTPSKKIIP